MLDGEKHECGVDTHEHQDNQVSVIVKSSLFTLCDFGPMKLRHANNGRIMITKVVGSRGARSPSLTVYRMVKGN